ncbi:hypothetical protein GCM10010915_12120 [Microbacterium faecale]|uniref:ERF family protein n=1 Tax=Microbacterium faecale TaxID=1804630 RepID=A0A916Y7N1_9MICO|nr:ERF family protein [Microbacterium faecale]GGD33317.1 hypothetical protein GCM10010915_12120 [Microbacterium faecale]
MTEKHESIAAALAAFQADLPKVGKNSTNPHFKSKYASLEDITAAVLPALGKVGLAWAAIPMTTEAGFVLRCRLMHTSGELIEGDYPVAMGQPQQVGSALTYARRYALCAVTGVAPDEDDDGNAAQSAGAPKVKPAPEGWRAQIAGAGSVDMLTSIYQEAQRGGWLSDDVMQALNARKTAVIAEQPS